MAQPRNPDPVTASSDEEDYQRRKARLWDAIVAAAASAAVGCLAFLLAQFTPMVLTGDELRLAPIFFAAFALGSLFLLPIAVVGALLGCLVLGLPAQRLLSRSRPQSRALALTAGALAGAACFALFWLAAEAGEALWYSRTARWPFFFAFTVGGATAALVLRGRAARRGPPLA